MRLDLFLKKTFIVRQRALAKELCGTRKVLLNDKPAKASQIVRPGDRIRLQLGNRDVTVRVIDVPAGNVARRDAGRWVEILRDARDETVEHVFESGEADASEARGGADAPDRDAS